MATGSQAAAKERLQAAGYWTGASSANSQPRCDTCVHCGPAPGFGKHTRYDRLCGHHSAGVKTHGCCAAWARKT